MEVLHAQLSRNIINNIVICKCLVKALFKFLYCTYFFLFFLCLSTIYGEKSKLHCFDLLWSMLGVESCTIAFPERHFLFTSSDTLVVGRIVHPEHTARNGTAKISASEIAMGSVVT